TSLALISARYSCGSIGSMSPQARPGVPAPTPTSHRRYSIRRHPWHHPFRRRESAGRTPLKPSDSASQKPASAHADRHTHDAPPHVLRQEFCRERDRSPHSGIPGDIGSQDTGVALASDRSLPWVVSGSTLIVHVLKRCSTSACVSVP